MEIILFAIMINSPIEATILWFLCQSQVRTKEERLTEGVQIPPSVKTTRRKKPAMNDYSTTPYQLGRHPGKQGPRPLSSDQGRIDKLATQKPLNTKQPTGNT